VTKVKVRRFYTAFAVVFLVLSLLTFMNVAAALREGVFLWQASLYGAINALVAYGFFSREKWLLPIFIINAGANLFLFFMSVSAPNAASVEPFTLLALSTMVAIGLFVYYTRDTLRNTSWSIYTGGPLFLLWVSAFSYTTLLTLN